MNKFILKDINASFESYQQLIEFYKENESKYFKTIEISFEKWFGANMSSVLGGILDILSNNLNSIIIKDIPDNIQRIIQKNGFLAYYGYPKTIDFNNTTIKYQKLKPNDGTFFNHYIMNELLERSELPKMSNPLKKKIAESIYELFANAKMHSKTKFVYTCGQFFPQKKLIEITITDTGIGFKNKINSRFGRDLTAIQAIEWAISTGHTTKQGISGGIGLSILKEFIEKNNGKIQIVSDNGFYQFSSNGLVKKSFSLPFPGSIINVQFRTDDILGETMEPVNIQVYSIVGNSLCVDAEDGQRVFDQISQALKANLTVVVSFLNVEMLTSAFLNTAIGQLYRDFSEEVIKKSLTTKDLSNVDKALLKRVVKTAKMYYKDPTWMEQTLSEITGENSK